MENHSRSAEHRPYAPPEVLKGAEVLEKLSSMLAEAHQNLIAGGEDITLTTVNSSIRLIDDYYEVQRAHHGSGLYLHLQADDNFKLTFKLDQRSDLEENDEKTKDLSDEETKEILSLFSLLITPNNIVVVGGSKDLTDDQLRRIAISIEDIDREISKKLAVKVEQKAVLVDAARMEEGAEGNRFQRTLMIFSESDLGSQDIPSDFRELTVWALTEFYFGDYENVSDPNLNINLYWQRVEEYVDRMKMRGPRLFDSRFNEERLLFHLQPFFPKATPERKLLQALGMDKKDGIKDVQTIFNEFREAGYDFRKVPELLKYKRYVDWITAYKYGFIDLLESIFSSDPRKKERLEKHGQVTDLNKAYAKILDESIEHPHHRSNMSQSQLRELMTAFMNHLIEQYAVTFFDLAKAVSMMGTGNYDITYFCQILDVDYQDAIKTWGEK